MLLIQWTVYIWTHYHLQLTAFVGKRTDIKEEQKIHSATTTAYWWIRSAEHLRMNRKESHPTRYTLEKLKVFPFDGWSDWKLTWHVKYNSFQFILCWRAQQDVHISTTKPADFSKLLLNSNFINNSERNIRALSNHSSSVFMVVKLL